MRAAFLWLIFGVLPGVFAALFCFWLLDGRPPEAWKFYREAKAEFDYGPDILLPSEVEQEGGHLKPNLNLKIRGAYRDEEILIQTNSKGFRNDREFSHEVPKDVKRILFIGDSYVDGYRTDQSKTIGYQLQTELGKSLTSTSVEVLIAGTSWDLAASWRYFQEYGKLYHPAILLVGVTLGNDLLTHYEVREIEESLGGVPTISLPRKNMGPGIALPPEVYRTEGILEQISNRVELAFRQRFRAFRRLGWLSPPKSGAEEPTPAPFRLTGDDMFMSLGFFLRDSPSWVPQDLARVFTYMNGLQALARERQAELIYVIFPTRIQVYPEEFDLFARLYGLRSESFDLLRPSQLILAECRSKNLQCIDLLSTLQKAAHETKSSIYLPLGDMHLNDTGQRVAAIAIAEYLRAKSEALRSTSDL